MNSFLLTVDGDEYRLKANTQSKIEAEKKLGMSLLRAQLRIDEAEVFAVILWASLQSLNHGMGMKETYELIDQMEDSGYKYVDPIEDREVEIDSMGVSEKQNLAAAILAVSGFFTKAEIEGMKERKVEATPRTPRKKKSTPPQQP